MVLRPRGRGRVGRRRHLIGPSRKWRAFVFFVGPCSESGFPPTIAGSRFIFCARVVPKFLGEVVLKFPLCALVLASVACSSEHPSTGLPPEILVDTIVLSPTPLVVHVSDYLFITATVYDRNHQRVESPGLKWTVEDASLAYISIGGDTLADLWGKAAGTTALSASFGGKTTRLPLQVGPMIVTKMTV